MSTDMQSRFDAGAETWAEYNQKPLGRIRCEVTWHNLCQHMHAITAGDCPCVLDVGGGSGELALRLVQRGYRVWLLDYAPAMLEQAQRAAQVLPESARARLNLCPMAVDDAPRSFAPGFFDVITCHTLIEYLADPRMALSSLVGLLADGGLLSISFVNRYAEVLRKVWSQADPVGALASLENGTFCATLFDVPGKAYTAEEVGQWLAELGLTVVTRHGIRAFADYVPREHLEEPTFFESLLRLELAVASRAPYKLLARYVHLIAHKCTDR